MDVFTYQIIAPEALRRNLYKSDGTSCGETGGDEYSMKKYLACGFNPLEKY